VWSLGCVLYEIICLKPPFQAEDMQNLYKKVVRGKFSKIPSSYSNDLWLIVQALLQVNPVNRPDCKTLMSYPSFKKMNQELFPDLYETGDSLFGD
jgi:NIMA (never in mitosis gene a)-related kinase 1/4/5